MGVGLLLLVSVGKENLYLSAQPEITFFKIAYRRHTNYSIEPTPQYFKTIPDFGRKCTVTVAKNADLVGMMYLYVELPYIQLENTSSINKQFAWVKKIGLALINFVEIEIGGSIIDRHYGDWLNIWHEITTSIGHKTGYNKMIGNIATNTEFSQTKLMTKLHIPLSFWFCLDSGLALPLIALTHNDVKIHVDFNDIDKCYRISPSHFITVTNNFCLFKVGEYFYQNYQNTKIIGEFIYFDPITNNLYYNQIKGKFIIPTILNDPTLVLIGEITNFIINIKPNTVVVTDEDYFKFNKPSLISSYLLINYIYLDNFERFNFINNENEYLIPIIQTLPEQIIYSTNIAYKLSLTNPIKFLVWRIILSSNINLNDHFNYTTYPYTLTEENLINKNTIVINSINCINSSSPEFYTYLQKYKHKLNSIQNGIYFYSFALNPLDLQPSGALNFSKIDDAYLQIKMNKIITYQNTAVCRCYGIQYNIFKTKNGIGGLQFSI